MTRSTSTLVVFAVLAWSSSAVLAQGQMPGTLSPAPPVVTPPPPVAPVPVPSVVTPLPQPSMGAPSNVNRDPVISSGGGTVRSIYRGPDGHPLKKKRKGHRRPRVSAY